jgi:aspartyl-tRNA(Asn)/glutamyl-tRNA(Gln) amidotransferase subunit A
VGPMARSATDCAELLQAMAAAGGEDGHVGLRLARDREATPRDTIEGLRIGVERDHHTRAQGVDPAVTEAFEQAIATLADLGADIVEISISGYEAVTQANVVLAFSESLAIHRRDLRLRWNDYGQSTRLALALGAVYTGADFAQSKRVCQAVRHEIEELLRSVDVIATITAGTGAPPLSGTDFATGFHVPVFVTIWNALGLPAVSVPMGFNAARLPVGMQLVGAANHDLFVLHVAAVYQKHTNWHRLSPPCTDSGSHLEKSRED